MKSRLISAVVATAAAACLAVAAGAPAYATSSASEAEDSLATVKTGYVQLGVSPLVADQLIETVTNGQPLDSMIEGSIPVRTENYIQVGDAPYAQDGDQVTVKWYADGSPAVLATQTPDEVANNTSRSIQGCTITSGSGYSNATGCTMTAWWGTIQIGFMGDYTLVQGGPDYIIKTYLGWQQCGLPTTCSRPVEVFSNYHEGTGPAFSRWGSTVTAAWGSWEVWLQLEVSNDYAYTNSP